MKRMFIALLCLLFVGLCACGEAVPSQETASAESPGQSIAESASQQTAATATWETKPLAVPTTRTVAIDPSEDDPYSFIVREYQDYMNDRASVATYYHALYDLDNDGTDELLLGVHVYADEELEITIYAISAIKNGVLVEVASVLWTEDDFPVTLFRNGTIMTVRPDSNERRIYYYRFENGELINKLGMLYCLYPAEYYRLEPIEDIPITKEEFERLQKEFEGDGQTVEIDWKPLAEYGQ